MTTQFIENMIDGLIESELGEKTLEARRAKLRDEARDLHLKVNIARAEDLGERLALAQRDRDLAKHAATMIEKDRAETQIKLNNAVAYLIELLTALNERVISASGDDTSAEHHDKAIRRAVNAAKKEGWIK